MGTLTDSRFIMGVVAGLAGGWAFHKFVKPVKGKGQASS